MDSEPPRKRARRRAPQSTPQQPTDKQEKHLMYQHERLRKNQNSERRKIESREKRLMMHKYHTVDAQLAEDSLARRRQQERDELRQQKERHKQKSMLLSIFSPRKETPAAEVQPSATRTTSIIGQVHRVGLSPGVTLRPLNEPEEYRRLPSIDDSITHLAAKTRFLETMRNIPMYRPNRRWVKKGETFLPWKSITFDENARPGFWGIYALQSSFVSARRPLERDPQFDYGYDSGLDDPSVEENIIESLSGDEAMSADEADLPPLPSGFIVPDGHLSEDEGDGDEVRTGVTTEQFKENLNLETIVLDRFHVWPCYDPSIDLFDFALQTFRSNVAQDDDDEFGETASLESKKEKESTPAELASMHHLTKSIPLIMRTWAPFKQVEEQQLQNIAKLSKSDFRQIEREILARFVQATNGRTGSRGKLVGSFHSSLDDDLKKKYSRAMLDRVMKTHTTKVKNQFVWSSSTFDHIGDLWQELCPPTLFKTAALMQGVVETTTSILDVVKPEIDLAEISQPDTMIAETVVPDLEAPIHSPDILIIKEEDYLPETEIS